MGRIPDPRIRHVLREIPVGAAVLDVGCVEHDADSAQLSDWLHRFLYRKVGSVLGIDIDETQVRRLQEQGWNVVAGNVETVDLKRRFDVVVAREVVEHLSNPGLFL